jgi:hypothetical protein
MQWRLNTNTNLSPKNTNTTIFASGKYPCTDCGLICPTAELLERHKSIHSSQAQSYKCKVPGCCRIFSIRGEYENHQRRCKPRQFLLPIGKSFGPELPSVETTAAQSLLALKGQRVVRDVSPPPKMHGPETPIAAQADAASELIQEDQDDEVFHGFDQPGLASTTISSINKRSQLSFKKNLRCKTCNKQFSSRQKLQLHQLIQCGINAGSTTPQTLARSKLKIFTCGFCGEYLNSLANHQEHERDCGILSKLERPTVVHTHAINRIRSHVEHHQSVIPQSPCSFHPVLPGISHSPSHLSNVLEHQGNTPRSAPSSSQHEWQGLSPIAMARSGQQRLSPVQSKAMYCKNCSKINDQNDKYCSVCTLNLATNALEAGGAYSLLDLISTPSVEPQTCSSCRALNISGSIFCLHCTSLLF